jgi:hypothetical protein
MRVSTSALQYITKKCCIALPAGDKDRLSKLEGDVGTVKGPGLGSLQGGVDKRGGTSAPDMAQQADTGKLEGSQADISGGGSQ